MNPGIALMPLASMVRRPCVGAAPAVTDTIFPPLTMMVPDSITWPEPTMIRALVIAMSCADATRGASNTITTRHTAMSSLFIVLT